MATPGWLGATHWSGRIVDGSRRRLVGGQSGEEQPLVAVTDAQIGRAFVYPEKLDAWAARRRNELPVPEVAVGEERPGRLGDQRSGESGGDDTAPCTVDEGK